MSEQLVRPTSYYPQIECEARKGDADWEVVVAVKDEEGHQQFLSVSTGMVNRAGGKDYLAIGVVQVDHRHNRVLVELPRESDAGVTRLWAPFESFRPRGAHDPP